MSARDAAHKKLVDAIIDNDMAAAELAVQGKILGGSLKARMMIVARELVKRRIAGKLSPEKAKWLWDQAFITMSLAAFGHIAEKVRVHATEASNAVVKAAKEVPDLRKVDAIRNADFKARALERAGVTNENGDLSPNGGQT